MDLDNSALTRVCIVCKNHIPDDANVCPQCGHDYRPAMEGQAWEDENTPLPPIGGALIALSGVIQIVSGLVWVIGLGFGIGYDIEGSGHAAIAAGLVGIGVGSFAVFVSPLAMTRRRLALSLAAGLAALAGVTAVTAYVLSVTSVSTGLVGVLMIAIARDEFVD